MSHMFRQNVQNVFHRNHNTFTKVNQQFYENNFKH
jgi:hypothetical protein